MIGDYGSAGPAELSVAKLVKSWEPAFVATTGDNNYPNGEASTIDLNIGQYFADFICPYRGTYGPGARTNRFFPALGNHDWYVPGARPYLEYFTLPGNERYYDVVWGSVHLWILDSDPSEPDGVTSDSVQAEWLKSGLSRANEPWQLVFMHHPPFSSGAHGSTSAIQWPFAAWGADVVFAGHDHLYERIERDGIVFIVNGLGARTIYEFGPSLAGSRAQYNASHGASWLEATAQRLTSRFVNVEGDVVDSFELHAPP